MNKFDELTKAMAQSVTRRGAVKKFGLGLAALALGCVTAARTTFATHCRPGGSLCTNDNNCCSGTCLKGSLIGVKKNEGACTN